MFKWDGSDITEFINSEETFIREAEYKKNTYWVIINGEETEICLARTSTSTLPCLIDEMKPIFGLEKVGSHWFKFKGKNMLINKLEIVDGCILEELTLKDIKYSKKLELEVQKIYIFRELLGMSKNFDSSVILRNKKYFMKPISFYEPNMMPSKNSIVLANTILEKWFSNTTVDEVVLKMFKVDKIENLATVLSYIKIKLDKIVERVNPESVTHVDEIVSRIRTRLQSIL